MNPLVRGEITITATDEVTGKVTVTKASNIVTLLTGELNSHNSKRMQNAILMVHPTMHEHNNPAKFLTIDSRIGAYVAGSVANLPYDNNLDDFWFEAVWRFPSSGAIQPIGAIGLKNKSSSSTTYYNSLASLDAIYDQQPTELVDIKYRLIFEAFDNLIENIPYRKYIALLFATTSITLNSHFDNMVMTPNLTKFPLRRSNSRNFGVNPSNIDESFRAFGKLDYTNKLLSSVFISTTNDQPLFETKIFDDLSNSYEGAPVGPLYNHSSGATLWCEDVTFLATGLGDPVITSAGVTWRSSYGVERYTFKIRKQGNLGTARFTYNIDLLTGDVTDNGEPDTFCYPPLVNGNTGTASLDGDIAFHTDYPLADESPFTQNQTNHAVFNTQWVMAYKSGNFALYNVLTAEYILFSPTTSPAMPNLLVGSANSHHIFRDDVGSIYVLVKTQGIVKITDPFGSPGISTISLGTIGASSHLITGCAITGNTIIVASPTALYTSTDNGSSWTEALISSFTNAGGSAIQFTKIRALQANPVRTNELMMIQGTTAQTAGAEYDSSNVGGNDAFWIDTTALEYMAFSSRNLYNHNERYSIFADGKHGVWLNLGSTAISRKCAASVQKFMTPDFYGQTSANITGERAGCSFFYDKLGNIQLISPSSKGDTDDSYTLTDMHGRNHHSIRYSSDHVKVASLAFGIRYDIVDGHGSRMPFSTAGYAVSVPSTFNSTCFAFLPARYDKTVAGFINGTDMGYNKTEGTLLDEFPHKLNFNWNNSTSAWIEDFNEVSPATVDGSLNSDAQRVNFKPDTNTFNGRCYLDITSTVDATDFDNGFSFIGKITTNSRDSLGTAGNYWHSNYVNREEGASALMSLYDSNADSGFGVVAKNHNNQVSVLDYTDPSAIVETELGASVADGTASRIAVTLNASGTTLKVFVNGILKGTVTLTNAFSLNNSGSNWKCYAGTLCRHKALDADMFHHLINGDITNIQVWNNNLIATQLVTDSITPDGLIVTTGLQSRYLMTSVFNEAKTITAAGNTLDNGVTITFGEGSLATESYILGDNYDTTIVKSGILKGNVESFELPQYWDLANKICDTMVNNSGSNTIPSASVQVTEPLLMIRGGQTNSNYFNGAGNNIQWANRSAYPAVAVQTSDSATAEFKVEGTLAEFQSGLKFNFNDCAYAGHTNYNTVKGHSSNLASFDFTPTTLVVDTNDEASSSTAVTLAAGDKIRIILDNGNYSFDKYDGGWVVLKSGTYTTPPNGIALRMWQNYVTVNKSDCFMDIFLSYSKPPSIMQIGNAALDEGVFDLRYNGNYSQQSTEKNVISLDGVPITAYSYLNSTSATTNASATMTFYQMLQQTRLTGSMIAQAQGFFIFSDADQGKAVTLASKLVYKISNKV